MSIDRESVKSALLAFFTPGDVFEVRVLDATTRDYRREHIESGYFDYEHIENVAEALEKLLSYRGVYVTVNPVNPDLLARAVYRLKPAGRNPTTSDADILERRWLLIDCDAVRPSGVSSNDEEYNLAYEKAQEIQEGLASLGWQEPIVIDSGNGSQLMYRIELPTKDDCLVQKVLTEIAKCSSDRVHVDLTVHNPARIWRLPGTMNCKGDSMPERPHRLAKIIHNPNSQKTLTQTDLEAILPPPEVTEETIAPQGLYLNNSFDLNSWIAQYCPGLGESKPWQGGRKWIFDVCPFNHDHTDKSAVLIEQPNGAIAFKCHHNGCIGNDWHKLRELFEPNCYERKTERDDSDVNLNALLNPQQEKIENLFPNPGIMPESLMQVGGFIEEVVQLTLSTAPYPNRVLAFMGALSLLAMLIGRKMQDKRDNRSNIYLVALADSGTGKDHPRKVNFNIAYRVGVPHLIGDSFASGEGLEDALSVCPSMLFQADEFDCIFNTLKTKDNRAESINEKLLKFYGASNTIYPMRKKAISKRNEAVQPSIVNPNLVLLGTAVPQYFYEALSKRVLENGLVARCIIVEAGKRGEAGDPSSIIPSESILEQAKFLVDFGATGNLTGEYPQPFIVPETQEASDILLDVRRECDAMYTLFERKGEAGAMALWARAYEKICKLSLIHAVSSDIYEPQITKASVKWAWRFVKHLTERMLYQANGHVYENVFDEKCKKAIRYIRKAGGTITHSKLLYQTHESADTFKKIIETLVESQQIESSIDRNKKKMPRVYTLLEF